MHSPTPDLPCSTAAERNRGPIWGVLRRLLAPSGHALEIASGTGQHAAHFAHALPGWSWQPSDVSDAGFATVQGWADRLQARNVRRPVRLDVLDAQAALLLAQANRVNAQTQLQISRAALVRALGETSLSKAGPS